MPQLRSIQVTLQLAQIGISDLEPPQANACLRCSARLELIQPDPEDPDRLIGACFDCGSWFLIGRPAGEDLVEILELPRRESRASPPLTTVWPGTVAGHSLQAGA